MFCNSSLREINTYHDIWRKETTPPVSLLANKDVLFFYFYLTFYLLFLLLQPRNVKIRNINRLVENIYFVPQENINIKFKFSQLCKDIGNSYIVSAGNKFNPLHVWKLHIVAHV